MRGIRLKSGQPEKIQIQLTHVKQRYSWDCGVSCVLMVLSRKNRQHFLENFPEICKEEGFNRSTWTIDLCYLLARFQVKHVFHTITLGVHPSYRNNNFYDSVLVNDESRIQKRFSEAAKRSIVILKTSVTCSDILCHLVNGPVILLTNSRLLTCDTCKFNKVSNELRKCMPWTTSFQGHYIVLCGYDVPARRVFYRNPSFSDRICVMPIDQLEQARKSYGTDQDTIFIYS